MFDSFYAPESNDQGHIVFVLSAYWFVRLSVVFRYTSCYSSVIIKTDFNSSNERLLHPKDLYFIYSLYYRCMCFESSYPFRLQWDLLHMYVMTVKTPSPVDII